MKKERLYLHELLDDPVVSYPAWYLLSPKLHRDENLRESIRALHSLRFEPYTPPDSPADLFAAFRAGLYPIYRERYVAGYFGGRVMLLESGGWKSLPLSEEAMAMESWLI
ncbi:hypothetical protein [Nitratifractor sp.]